MTEKAPEAEREKAKIKPIHIIVFILFWVCVGLYNMHSSKTYVQDFATEQLTSQGYTILELSLTESHTAKGKFGKATGKVNFIVKDNKGIVFIGNASVNNERSYLIFDKSNFIIDNISKK